MESATALCEYVSGVFVCVRRFVGGCFGCVFVCACIHVLYMWWGNCLVSNNASLANMGACACVRENVLLCATGRSTRGEESLARTNEAFYY